MQSSDESILTIGLSLEPITDFWVLQLCCPEARIFIDYLENGYFQHIKSGIED